MKDMSNLSKKCVVYASTPLHAISAVSAILTQNSHSNIVVKVLIQWPGPVDDASLEIAKIIAEILSQFNFIESVKRWRDFPFLAHRAGLSTNES